MTMMITVPKRKCLLVLEATVRASGISLEALRDRSIKTRDATYARTAAVYILKTYYDKTYMEIGNEKNLARDHSTLIYLIEKWANHPGTLEMVNKILKDLLNS